MLRAAQAERTLPVLLSFALTGGLGFMLGESGLLLEEVDEVSAPGALVRMQQDAPPSPPTPSRAYPAAERVSLTVSEQRARMALRVESDKRLVEELKAEARKVTGPPPRTLLCWLGAAREATRPCVAEDVASDVASGVAPASRLDVRTVTGGYLVR